MVHIGKKCASIGTVSYDKIFLTQTSLHTGRTTIQPWSLLSVSTLCQNSWMVMTNCTSIFPWLNKAFDTVLHNIFCMMITMLPMNPCIFNCIKIFLEDKKQSSIGTHCHSILKYQLWCSSGNWLQACYIIYHCEWHQTSWPNNSICRWQVKFADGLILGVQGNEDKDTFKIKVDGIDP